MLEKAMPLPEKGAFFACSLTVPNVPTALPSSLKFLVYFCKEKKNS